MLQKKCRQCSAVFDITANDLKFYDKVSPAFGGEKYPVPPPTLCPACRQQRRLVWRNERKLYHRKCDLSGKEIISVYSADKSYPIYGHSEWWSDRWDALQYGREFDFKRPFFEQFGELLKVVPRLAMMISDKNENSDYCPYSVGFKNSYRCVSGVGSENAYYCFFTSDSKDCMDCYCCFNSELCYECTEGINLYCCRNVYDCENCNDCAFCIDCRGCTNCIGCYGLRNKQYYIFNQKVSKQEFEKVWATMSSRNVCTMLSKQLKEYSLQFPRIAMRLISCANSTGDYLKNCQNARECFQAGNLEDCAFIWNGPHQLKDSYDNHYSPDSELLYEAMSGVNTYQCMNVAYCWDTANVLYSFETFYSKNCFGCAGLKHQEYCILNRQYKKEEYEKLVPRIIEHMQKTPLLNCKQAGEWGEFFPLTLAPFAYNETIAQDFFPLSKAQTILLGSSWKEDDLLSRFEGPRIMLPDRVEDSDDVITRQILTCESCQRNYKIIPQEFDFYRKLKICLPQKCFDCRHMERQRMLNPRKLWERNCQKCAMPMETSYPPESPATVYCEKCYLETVY